MQLAEYEFLRRAGRIINAGLARTVILSGNIQDLFFLSGEKNEDGTYVPLSDLLISRWSRAGKIIVSYEVNGPIRFIGQDARKEVETAWCKWRIGLTNDDLVIKKMFSLPVEEKVVDFESLLRTSQQNSAYALEFLRQLCLCSRSCIGNDPLIAKDLIIIIERTDMLLPNGEISRLSDADRHRLAVCTDWFSDNGFLNGNDSVILITESRSLINQEISRLPQIVEVEIPPPDKQARENFIQWYALCNNNEPKLWSTPQELATLTAGLSIHALRQLLRGAHYDKRTLMPEDVVTEVEVFIKSQLGEEVIEFKKPTQRLQNVVGFSTLKEFLQAELIPRFQSTDPEDALSGAIVCGPNGVGKTFILEAVAGELDCVVLMLKNIRDMYFGGTDVIIERLRRVLQVLEKVLIFVDEADTQFGGLSPETHPTERRLTGKIQQMMSDPTMRSRVKWLLITARVQYLSPDIRRSCRGGDLIIPILDPAGNDRREFIRWILSPLGHIPEEDLGKIDEMTQGYSPSDFSSLRTEINAAQKKSGILDFPGALEIIHDHLPPAISEERRYQTLQALINCTRKCFWPSQESADSHDPRREWKAEIQRLEAAGMR